MTLSADSLLSAAIDWLSGGLLQLAWWQVLLIGLVLTHITIVSVTLY